MHLQEQAYQHVNGDTVNYPEAEDAGCKRPALTALLHGAQ
jgi:hypothetical protein